MGGFFFLSSLVCIVVGCLVGQSSLGTKHKLGFLHLSFQLCSVYRAGIMHELLMSLSRMGLVDGNLICATELEVTLSQIYTCSSWSARDDRFITRSDAVAFIGAVKPFSALRPSCNAIVKDLDVAWRNRKTFSDLNFLRLTLFLLRNTLVCA